MGLWTDLKAWVGLGNKAGDVVDTGLKLLESGARGIDALWHTDEEKSREQIEGRKALLDHAVKISTIINESNTMSSRTRQVLAFAITINVLLAFNFCVGFLAIAYLRGKESIILAKDFAATVILLVDKFYIGEAFAGVIGVFFLYYGIKKGLNVKG